MKKYKYDTVKRRDYNINYQREIGRYAKKGITKEEYNEAFFRQEGCCGVCKIHQENLKYSLHIDHCHKTNKFRGLLCNSCNTGLGKLGDNEEGLLKALDYIRKTK